MLAIVVPISTWQPLTSLMETQRFTVLEPLYALRFILQIFGRTGHWLRWNYAVQFLRKIGTITFLQGFPYLVSPGLTLTRGGTSLHSLVIRLVLMMMNFPIHFHSWIQWQTWTYSSLIPFQTPLKVKTAWFLGFLTLQGMRFTPNTKYLNKLWGPGSAEWTTHWEMRVQSLSSLMCVSRLTMRRGKESILLLCTLTPNLLFTSNRNI